jgi:hypothetical protein
MADAMELSKQVYDICESEENPSTELRVSLDDHPQVSVTHYRNVDGMQALHVTSMEGHAARSRS